MADNNSEKRGSGLGTLIGWLIFILVIAGGPILNAISNASGGQLRLPNNLLPLLIGGLVLLSIVVPAIRAIGGAMRNQGEMRTPGSASRPWDSPAHPPASPRSFQLPTRSNYQVGKKLEFDPVIDPKILGIGIIGLVILGFLALGLYLTGSL